MKKLIYLWFYESEASRSHYKSKSKAITALLKKHKCLYSFGISEYVNTANASLLDFIKDRLVRASSPECQENASAGVYKDRAILEFRDELKKLIKELDNG